MIANKIVVIIGCITAIVSSCPYAGKDKSSLRGPKCKIASQRDVGKHLL